MTITEPTRMPKPRVMEEVLRALQDRNHEGGFHTETLGVVGSTTEVSICLLALGWRRHRPPGTSASAGRKASVWYRTAEPVPGILDLLDVGWSAEVPADTPDYDISTRYRRRLPAPVAAPADAVPEQPTPRPAPAAGVSAVKAERAEVRDTRLMFERHRERIAASPHVTLRLGALSADASRSRQGAYFAYPTARTASVMQLVPRSGIGVGIETVPLDIFGSPEAWSAARRHAELDVRRQAVAAMADALPLLQHLVAGSALKLQLRHFPRGGGSLQLINPAPNGTEEQQSAMADWIIDATQRMAIAVEKCGLLPRLRADSVGLEQLVAREGGSARLSDADGDPR